MTFAPCGTRLPGMFPRPVNGERVLKGIPMKETLSCQHEETMNTKIELSHLGPAQIARFHQAVLDILERTGVMSRIRKHSNS